MGKIYDRKTGNTYEDKQYKGEVLAFLYNNIFGRMILKVLIMPFVSKIYGNKNDKKKSISKIDKFIKDNNIDMSLYEKQEYGSFNEFFARQKIIRDDIKANFENKELFISPADSKLLCYKFSEDLKVNIKNSTYDIQELVQKSTDELDEFKNGNVLVFRLSVDDFHRFCYVDDGTLKSSNEIKGVLHTVSSISKRYKIFKENHRVVDLINTETFGDIYYIAVGALLVGKIVDERKENFKKGEEKGYFKYGGSTVILLTKDNIILDEDILENSKNDIETKIEYGEKIGIKA